MSKDVDGKVVMHCVRVMYEAFLKAGKEFEEQDKFIDLHTGASIITSLTCTMIANQIEAKRPDVKIEDIMKDSLAQRFLAVIVSKLMSEDVNLPDTIKDGRMLRLNEDMK